MNTLEDNRWTQSWREIGASMARPRAILCVSAHWYTQGTGVTAMAQPDTLHDFGGFPQALFDVRYPAPGDPALARRVCELLSPSVEAVPVIDWGLDHGSWSVLAHAFPKADVPVVQLSIDARQAPRWHFEVGARLAALRDEGVLLMGSGNVVHNLSLMTRSGSAAPLRWAQRFDQAIREAIERQDDDAVIDWRRLGEDAQLSVPNPDHYLPLLYVLGSRGAGEQVSIRTPDVVMGSLTMTTVVVGG